MIIVIINLVIGLFYIGLGFLVRIAPDLIAGYNTMSKEKKKNVDIVGLSAFMKKGLIIIGITLIISSVFLKIIHLGELIVFTMMFFMLIGHFILAIRAQKYDHNPRKNKYLVHIIYGIIVLFVGAMLLLPFISTKAIFEEEKIRFSGVYGLNLNISDIESVELADKIPKIKIKPNGVGIGNIKKGHYILESWGTCRLLIHSNTPPYLVITKNDGKKIILNYKEKAKTEDIYKQIQLLIEK